MKIGYMTIDEVHGECAVAAGSQCRLDVQLLEPRDVGADLGCDRVLLDWDFLSPGRRELLQRLLSATLPPAVAVHSYDLDEQDWLRSQGLTVFARLDVDTIRALLPALRPTAA
jgi:hypothetical protein